MEKERGMNMYEVGYLVMPIVAEETAREEHAAIRAGLEKLGAIISEEDVPRMRPLAYSIPRRISDKKFNFTDAYFAWIRYEVSPALAASVKEMLDRRENLLRHLTISLDKKGLIAAAEAKAAREKAAAEHAATVKTEEGETEMTNEQLDKQIEDMLAPTA